MTWVLDVPGGEGTDARRRKPAKHIRHRAVRMSRSGPTDVLIVVIVEWTGWGRGAGMVVGWG